MLAKLIIYLNTIVSYYNLLFTNYSSRFQIYFTDLINAISLNNQCYKKQFFLIKVIFYLQNQ